MKNMKVMKGENERVQGSGFRSERIWAIVG